MPIVALTAHALSGERERCLAAGMDGYLAKPFKAHELFALVEGWGPTAQARRGPDAPTPDLAIVDLAGLRAELRAAGAEDALEGIVATFITTAPARAALLRDALTSGTGASVARAAHGLRSSAAAIGAGALASLLGELEAAGAADALGDREAAARRLEAA